MDSVKNLVGPCRLILYNFPKSNINEKNALFSSATRSQQRAGGLHHLFLLGFLRLRSLDQVDLVQLVLQILLHLLFHRLEHLLLERELHFHDFALLDFRVKQFDHVSDFRLELGIIYSEFVGLRGGRRRRVLRGGILRVLCRCGH